MAKIKIVLNDTERDTKLTAAGTVTSADKTGLLPKPHKLVEKDKEGRLVRSGQVATVESASGETVAGVVQGSVSRQKFVEGADGQPIAVSKGDIELWEIDPEGNESPYKGKSWTPTFGANHEQVIQKFKPRAELRDFLIDKYMDIVPDEGQEGNLFLIAKHLAENDLIGVGTAVTRSGVEPIIILIAGEIEGDKFRLTAYTTGAKSDWKWVPVPGALPTTEIKEEIPDLTAGI